MVNFKIWSSVLIVLTLVNALQGIINGQKFPENLFKFFVAFDIHFAESGGEVGGVARISKHWVNYLK